MLAESWDFDESNTHGGRTGFASVVTFSVKEKAEEQTDRWGKMLTKWGLEFFHMVDCAHNVEGFKHLTKNECDWLRGMQLKS